MMRVARTLLAASLCLLPALAGCGLVDRDVVALLLPGSDATRWTERDQVVFEREVADRCPSCEVKVYLAEYDEQAQATQLDQALDAGADVIVLAAISQDLGEELLVKAGSTPVIAYDRFIAGADYYVSFDSAAVGHLQAQALLRATGPAPRLLVINGGAGDPNALALRQATGKVFTAAKVTVLASADPANWHTETARKWVSEQLEQLGDDEIDGVYAANDAQASGVVEAFREADRPLVPLTGQDGELEALQRIIRGEQTMTVYKSVADEAGRAASLAVQLVTDQPIEGAVDVEGVPSYLFEPVAVTVRNLADTVVRDGFLTIDQLCTPQLKAACVRQGLA